MQSITYAIAQRDTLPKPGIPPADTDILVPPVSQNALDSELDYGSEDSSYVDNINKTIHLFGNAYVNYRDKELKADHIILELDRNIAEALKFPDKPGGRRPTFKDAGKEYEYNRLRYNFETEKGLVIDAVTREGEFIVHGERIKYIKEKEDSLGGAIINSKNSLITTCQHDEPHFGIRASKMKMLTNRLAVFGPSNLELGGVPTPIIIPFGIYPMTQGKSSGFIFPQNYQFNSRALGFGLLGFGWYFPINDYVHVRLTADLYTRGTYALYANTSYRKKYKYQGTVRLSFNDRRTDGVRTVLVDGEPVQMASVISEKGYSISIDHKQDNKAHPFVDVGGRINVVGNNNQNRNFNDARSVLTNTYTSNFYYRHKMPGTPFSFNLGLNHNQNTRTGIVNITLPDIQLNMNTIYPFESRNRGSNKEKWYEKISFDYDLKMRSFVTTTDSTLFTPEMYDDIKTGMTHSVLSGFSTRVLKYFNFVPRVSYDETWVLNTIDKSIEVSEFTEQDTLITDVVGGFDSYRTLRAGASINTQLFGTLEFSKGWFRGIRHTMKPEIGYSYAPDTRDTYRDTVYYTDAERAPEIYTRFDNGPFNNPNFTELQSQMTFRIQNIVEMKYFSKRDSTTKKFKIFDNLTLSGTHNFAKDSIKWSTINVNSTSRFFNGITTLISSWTFDPYQEENNRTIDRFVWTDSKSPVRLETGQVRLTNRLSFKRIKEFFSKKEQDRNDNSNSREADIDERSNAFLTGPPQDREVKDLGKTQRKGLFTDLLENISIDHNMLYTFNSDDGSIRSEMRTNAIAITGRIPLTENWMINIGNLGYDFVNKGLSYTAITFTRKLHCWDMNFSWFPNRDTYTFSIGVSSNILSFLKYNYGQNNVDGLFNRF